MAHGIAEPALHDDALPGLLKCPPRLLLPLIIAQVVMSLFCWRVKSPAVSATVSFLSVGATALFVGPTVARRLSPGRQLMRGTIEVATYLAILIAAVVTQPAFREPILRWVFYPMVVIIVSLPIALGMERYKQRTVGQCRRDEFRPLLDYARQIDRLFEQEAAFYLAVWIPLLLTGIITTLWTLEANQALSVALFLILGFTAALIGYFLLLQIRGMLQSMAHGIPPICSEDAHEFPEDTLNHAVMAMHLRRVYLADATHNVIILIVFVGVAVALAHVHISIQKVLPCMIVSGILVILTQIPYVLGQQRLRNTMLGDTDGIQRARLLQRLDRYIPMWPQIGGACGQILISLIANGLFWIFQASLQ